MQTLTKAQSTIRMGDTVIVNHAMGMVIQVVVNDDGTRGADIRTRGSAKAFKYDLASVTPITATAA